MLASSGARRLDEGVDSALSLVLGAERAKSSRDADNDC
nr:MAG TPA: hypothetical protein [Caudoviricetes sp.]